MRVSLSGDVVGYKRVDAECVVIEHGSRLDVTSGAILHLVPDVRLIVNGDLTVHGRTVMTKAGAVLALPRWRVALWRATRALRWFVGLEGA